MKFGIHRRKPLTAVDLLVGGSIAAVLSVFGYLKKVAGDTPGLYLLLYGGVVVLALFVLSTFWRGSGKVGASTTAEGDSEALPETLDLAGIRIAMSGRALADVRAAIPDTRGPATLNQVRSVASTLLGLQECWVFTSLESTPRRPLAQLAQAASRLMDDASKRFPAPVSTDTSTHDAFRSPTTRGDSVFVVSLVFTSRANITDHKGESHEQTRELLTEMSSLAERVHTLDVFVSGVLSVDELAQRDPAMRGIA